MDLKGQLRERWAKLDGKQRERTVKLVIGVVGISVAMMAYFATGQDKKVPPPAKAPAAVINVGEGRMEDDVRAQVEKQRQAQVEYEKKNAEKEAADRQKLEDMKAQLTAINGTLDGMSKGGAPGQGKPAAGGPGNPPQWPDQWQPGAPGAPGGAPGAGGVPPVPVVKELVGGIGTMTGGPSPDAGKKKAVKKFYLPVGFMPAKLLTGLKAKTVETARNDPEPMLLRVQAPAVLPNEVRAALKGCFVVANGFGSLAAERIEARLVSLNCVDFDDHSVIEAEVKGILVDKDGVKGLAAHIVSKAGTVMARALIAGAFQGAGQALSQSSSTQSVSALGSTTAIQPSQIGNAALGNGLASSANEMSKVFLDLVRQSAPVAEHGADTDCSVFMTEGVWLEIKDLDSGVDE